MTDSSKDYFYLKKDSNRKAENKLSKKNKWKIMIVDDEEDVHKVTKLVLSTFSFDDRDVEFISAYSGKEAKHLIATNPDTALIFVDVIMESDNAGLLLVKEIREVLKNHLWLDPIK